MITTTPALDPRTVETVLVAILDPEATLPAVARAAGMTVDALLELLESPEMKPKLERLQRVTDMRARLLATTAETAALGALNAHMVEIHESEAERTKLASARKAALANKDRAAVERAESALAELDARFRKRTEAAKSARATLTHARSRSKTLAPAVRTPHPSPLPPNRGLGEREPYRPSPLEGEGGRQPQVA